MESSYSKINNSFKNKLVYNLGGEAGFFSEYNNMVLAMLYCLKNKIKFVLYSKEANFAYKNGWTDYFLPFCDETIDPFHAKYNPRQLLKKEVFSFYFYRKLFKIAHRIKYLTSDLWPKFHSKEFENEFFDIPELNIKGSTQLASKQLIEITWRYNSTTFNIINRYIVGLSLPEKYIGFHIRSGDKLKEYITIQPVEYIDFAIKYSEIRKAFILTDNYEVISELKNKYPIWDFETLCQENERGYVFQEFISRDKNAIKENLLKLFASVDILSKSQLFVGTFSSNPGMYLGMRMESNRAKGIDFKNWVIW